MKVLSKPLHDKHIIDDEVMSFEATHTSIYKNEMYCVKMLEDEEAGQVIRVWKKKSC